MHIFQPVEDAMETVVFAGIRISGERILEIDGGAEVRKML